SRLSFHSVKRTQVRLKPLLSSVQLPRTNLQPHHCQPRRRESTVRGLNALRTSWGPLLSTSFVLLHAAAETALTLTLPRWMMLLEKMRTRFVSAIVRVSETQLVVGGEAGLTVAGQVGIKRCPPRACLSFVDWRTRDGCSLAPRRASISRFCGLPDCSAD